MAFNLNKNDASAESSTSGSKFELSKNTIAADESIVNQPKKSNTIEPKKSNTIVYLVIGLLLVGNRLVFSLKQVIC